MNQLTEYRREFHKYPENGWREFRTSARVAEILTGMGYDVAMGPDVICLLYTSPSPRDTR